VVIKASEIPTWVKIEHPVTEKVESLLAAVPAGGFDKLPEGPFDWKQATLSLIFFIGAFSIAYNLKSVLNAMFILLALVLVLIIKILAFFWPS
jgi:hypothetical protein